MSGEQFLLIMLRKKYLENSKKLLTKVTQSDIMVSVGNGKRLKVKEKEISKFLKKFLTNALRYDKMVSVKRAVIKFQK